MKRLIFIFGLFLFLWGCEDPIHIPLPEPTPYTVIDATLWRPVAGNKGTLEVVVSQTSDFYSDTVPYVSGASVSLTHGNRVVVAQEAEAGHYRAAGISVTENTDFTLRVESNGTLYTATESLVLSTKLHVFKMIYKKKLITS